MFGIQCKAISSSGAKTTSGNAENPCAAISDRSSDSLSSWSFSILIPSPSKILTTVVSPHLPSSNEAKRNNPGRLLGKVRIARKDPAAVLPGFDGISAQPTPNRNTADVSNDATAYGLTGNIHMARSGKRNISFAGHLASERFYLHHNFRGKNGTACRALDDLGDRSSVLQRTVCATC